MESEDVETISIKARIPTFWRDKPTLWFGQFETVVTPQKPSDEAKFSLMVAHLDRMDVEQIGDIVMSKSRTGRYEEAKKRLLAVYEESETKQLHKLLNEMELGDQKPSQLLRRMREPAQDKIPDSTLQILWMRHLPASTRTVLAVSEQSSLDVLAAMADKMQDQATEINAICSCTCKNHATPSTSRIPEHKLHDSQDLRTAVMQLTKEIAELKLSRRPTRPPHRFTRSRSHSRSHSGGRHRMHKYEHKAAGACYYHARFGERARNCRSPCNFRKPQEN